MSCSNNSMYTPNLRWAMNRTQFDDTMQQTWGTFCDKCGKNVPNKPINNIPTPMPFIPSKFPMVENYQQCNGGSLAPPFSAPLYFPNNGALAIQDPDNLWSYTAKRM